MLDVTGALRIDGLRNVTLSPHIPTPVPMVRGVRLLVDAPRGSGTTLSIVRSIVRANPRMAPMDALVLADEALRAARRAGIDAGFFAATLLQESAFDPTAMSPAGACGIAQFMPQTAADIGVSPFDPHSAIDGAARLIATYLARYTGSRDGAFPVTLAAYNAGPAAVAYYGGVPPYPETRGYIADIVERWARLIAER